MQRISEILAVATLAVLVAFAVSAQDKPTPDTVLATVDGTDLTLGHVIALRGRLPQRYQSLADDVLFSAIVDQLIQQTVLMNAAQKTMGERLSLSLENETRAFLAAEMMTRISEREITEEELQSAFAERFDGFVPRQEYNASHILVATEAEAQELVKLLQDGADFAELAKEKSTGPSGPTGGLLPWFAEGDMVPEFYTAVVAMAVGENSAPVQTEFGWHIIHLNDMRDIPAPTLQEVRPRLLKELQQQRIEAEVQRLTEAADVTRTVDGIDPAVIRDVSLFED